MRTESRSWSKYRSRGTVPLRIAPGLSRLIWVCCAMIACNKGGRVEVELDAFSGLPNPKWELPPDKASALLSKIASLSEEITEAPAPGLGYRGFVLRSGERSYRVYRGRVTMNEHGVSRTCRDTANIEAELATEARQRGYKAVVGDVPGRK